MTGPGEMPKDIEEIKTLFGDEAKRITDIANYSRAKKMTGAMSVFVTEDSDDDDDDSVLSEREVFKRAINLTGADVEHIPHQMRL